VSAFFSGKSIAPTSPRPLPSVGFERGIGAARNSVFLSFFSSSGFGCPVRFGGTGAIALGSSGSGAGTSPGCEGTIWTREAVEAGVGAGVGAAGTAEAPAGSWLRIAAEKSRAAPTVTPPALDPMVRIVAPRPGPADPILIDGRIGPDLAIVTSRIDFPADRSDAPKSY
jgi:hypothetical protein